MRLDAVGARCRQTVARGEFQPSASSCALTRTSTPPRSGSAGGRGGGGRGGPRGTRRAPGPPRGRVPARGGRPRVDEAVRAAALVVGEDLREVALGRLARHRLRL